MRSRTDATMIAEQILQFPLLLSNYCDSWHYYYYECQKRFGSDAIAMIVITIAVSTGLSRVLTVVIVP